MSFFKAEQANRLSSSPVKSCVTNATPLAQPAAPAAVATNNSNGAKFDFAAAMPKDVLELCAQFGKGDWYGIRDRTKPVLRDVEARGSESSAAARSTARALDILVRFELGGCAALPHDWLTSGAGQSQRWPTLTTPGLWPVLGYFQEYVAEHRKLAAIVADANAKRSVALPDAFGTQLSAARKAWNALCERIVDNDLPEALQRYFMGFALSSSDLGDDGGAGGSGASASAAAAAEKLRRAFGAEVPPRDCVVAWGEHAWRFQQDLARPVAPAPGPALRDGTLVTRDREGNEVAAPAGATGAMKELFDLVGLAEVKTFVRGICDGLAVARLQGLTHVPLGNVVFTGNPGTGKTVVARLFARILHDLGVIPEQLDAEVPRKPPKPTPPSPPPPAANNNSAQLQQVAAQIQQAQSALQPPPAKVPLPAAAIADADRAVADAKTKADAQALLQRLATIQDEYEAGAERHRLERSIKAKVRAIDPGALPTPQVPFLETSGGELDSMGRDKAAAAFAAHRPGVVFIDEAYQLPKGSPVLDLLLTEMENHRHEQAFVLAGYEDEIDKLLKTNPGFQSRVSHSIRFPDYTHAELYNIFIDMTRTFGRSKAGGASQPASAAAAGAAATATATAPKQQQEFVLDNANTAKAAVHRVSSKSGGVGFGNARDIRAFVEKMMFRQRQRLSQTVLSAASSSNATPTNGGGFLYTVTEGDALGGTDLSPLTAEIAALGRECVGMRGAKAALVELAGKCLRRRVLEHRGELEPPAVYHRVIMGGPGTGKTSFARRYAKLLYLTGQVQNDVFVETRAMELKGDWIGHSKTNTLAALKKADGGVLFIDEAYDLNRLSHTGGQCPFCEEIVSTLVGRIEGKPTDRVVLILAGYDKQMQRMLDAVNPGLKRRMQYPQQAFVFPDFDDGELYLALRSKIAQSKEFCDRVAQHAKKNGASADGSKAAAALVDACERSYFDPVMQKLQSKRQLLHFGNMGDVDAAAREVVGAWARRQHEFGDATSLGLIRADFAQSGNNDAEARERARLLAELPKYPALVRLEHTFATAIYNARDTGNPVAGALNLCFVFTGPPGTGKTSGARIVGAMLHRIGVLGHGRLVEKSVSQMQTGYVGQAGLTTRAMLDEALGGVLFIDEAYRLAGFSFGKEILDEIVQACTEEKYKGKVAIVLAGYAQQMAHLVKRSNPGLQSRFQHVVKFAAWDDAQCCAHFHALRAAAGYLWEGGAEGKVAEVFARLRAVLTNFASGRTATELYEKCTGVRRGRMWTLQETVVPAANAMLALEALSDDDDDDDDDNNNNNFGRDDTTDKRDGRPPVPTQEQSATPPQPPAAAAAAVAPKAASRQASKQAIEVVDENERDDQQQQQQHQLDKQKSTDDEPSSRLASQLAEQIEALRETQRRAEALQVGAADGADTVSEEGRRRALEELRRRLAVLEAAQAALAAQQAEEARLEAERRALESRLRAAADAAERARLEEERLRQEAARARALEQLRRQQELARQALEAQRAEERRQERLRTMGVCPKGFLWRRLDADRWICCGGSHIVSDAELQ